MKKHLSKKRVVLAAIVTVVLAIASGVAYAYWTSTGAGTGAAAAGSGSTVTVTQVGTVTNLVPGGTAQAIGFKITNGATNNQYIATVGVSISSVTGPNITVPHPCGAVDFTLVQPTAINADLVPGDTTFSPSGGTILMKDTLTNQDGCKGATVNLAFAAS